MLYGIYEFEIVESEGGFVAAPYDLDGATQADTWDELMSMVADWLKVALEDYDIHGKGLPQPTYGNKPRFGGTNMVFAVQAGRETVERVTAGEAARLLNVSPSRVSQMVSAGTLDGWREGRNSYVTLDSVTQRLREGAHAGRPRALAVV